MYFFYLQNYISQILVGAFPLQKVVLYKADLNTERALVSFPQYCQAM